MSDQSTKSVRPIIVPVDVTGCADEVVAAALQVCQPMGAPAILLDVVDTPDGLERTAQVEGATARELLRGDACAHLFPLASILEDAGVKVSLHVREGDVVESILKEVRDTGAQMIIMGTHGRRGLSRFVYGSVAEEVVRGSDVPVMVVRTQSIASHPGVTEAQERVNAEAMG